MAVQPIRLFGDPILRKRAIEVDAFDKEIRTLVQDLTDTMLAAPGAGLAAPQIGVGLRVFTWNVEGTLGHLINPVLSLSDETQDGAEGCLSLPELTYECLRALSVVATGFDMYGEPCASRAPTCSPARSSTRPTTWTGSCSSTSSTPRPASWR